MTRAMPLRLLVALCLSVSPVAEAADAVVPGIARIDATFDHLGAIWEIGGDDDGDSTFLLEFREQGSGAWLAAAIPMRAEPGMIVDGAPLGLNFWAASCLFLESGTTYDLRLTLEDPDGGGEIRTLIGSTKTEMQAATGGRQLFVAPGSGGGSGSSADPFLGLQEAADQALPGDVFHVAAGTYEAFQLSASGSEGLPIAFLGPDSGEAIIDGGDTAIGVVTIGTYSSTPIAWVLLEGFTIQNGRWGVDAQHSSHIAIRNNTIRDIDYGILNRRDADQERDQTICDNVISGRTTWPGSGIPSERGIDLRGYGNVICHNRVSNFGDCVSVQPFTGTSYGNDVFGNDISRCVDDGIEIDYNQANVRVWRNRVYNTRMGISVQPIRGGPAYLFRNELFNQENKPLKIHNDPVGIVVAHNTSVKLGNAMHDTGSSIWRNAFFRNNLFLGIEYAFEFVTVATDGFRDFDYNAWGSTRAGTSGEPWFKWDDIRYDDLADLQSGTGSTNVEDHGVEASFSDVIDAALPASWDVEVPLGSRDLRLAKGAPEVDAGIALTQLNDAFPLTGDPDMGAFERGQAYPSYGPRTSELIFADGFESGDTAQW